MSTVLVAAAQLVSGDDEERNFARVEALAQRARARGASLVAFPENVLYEGSDKSRRHPLETWEPRFSALARELELTLLAGTVREPTADPARAFNTLLVYGPDGERIARYRKLHLFDVDVPGGPNERESEYVRPGDEGPVACDLPGLGRVGLSVCYDLRFPELYRRLVDAGARWLCVPSAFTRETGAAHWEVLLRARAIESQCFVLAPAQCGHHGPDRASFGHSLVVDPWGGVLARAGDEPTVLVADCDPAAIERARRAVPSLRNRRL